MEVTTDRLVTTSKPAFIGRRSERFAQANLATAREMQLTAAGTDHQSQAADRIPVQGRFRWWSKAPEFKPWLILAGAVLLVMETPPICAAELTASTLSPAAPTKGAAGGEFSHVDTAKEAPVRPPLILKARIMERPPAEYPTRILAHLTDFKPGKPVQLDPYGGWRSRQREARGFFYTEQVDGRWWLVDPDGCLFLSIGVNAVRAGTSPQMQKALPVRFGTAEKWRDATIALLRKNGFNSSGAWSDDAFLRQATQRIVYTPNLRFMAAYAASRRSAYQRAGKTGYRGDCMFLFDPGFQQFVDEYARQISKLKDDPYLLGYFSDNELPFFPDSLNKFLKLDAAEPGRQAAEAWLAKREGGKPDPAGVTEADRLAWVGFMGEHYFRIVSRALKKNDPNHLYLGCRLHWRALECPALFEAAGRYLDVVSVNCYNIWDPREKIEQWSGWSGRPVMITEWYAKGDDSGLPNRTGAGWTLATQEDRGWFYQHFALAMLESRDCVGWHWFKYIDNDPLDTKVDPSNRDSNKGIVTTSYQPYEPLLRAMRELNFQVYPLTVYFDKPRGSAGGRSSMKAQYQP